MNEKKQMLWDACLAKFKSGSSESLAMQEWAIAIQDGARFFIKFEKEFNKEDYTTCDGVFIDFGEEYYRIFKKKIPHSLNFEHEFVIEERISVCGETIYDYPDPSMPTFVYSSLEKANEKLAELKKNT